MITSTIWRYKKGKNKMKTEYQGIVRDRLGGWIVFQSRKCATYYDAHKRAEKRIKEISADDNMRYEVDVIVYVNGKEKNNDN